jgi:hypothetical protein
MGPMQGAILPFTKNGDDPTPLTLSPNDAGLWLQCPTMRQYTGRWC